MHCHPEIVALAQRSLHTAEWLPATAIGSHVPCSVKHLPTLDTTLMLRRWPRLWLMARAPPFPISFPAGEQPSLFPSF